MMAKKTYVGYDLGDGETITDLVTLESGKSTTKTNFDNMTMPDTTIPGKAMPTIFAYDENGEVIFSQTISADPEAVKNIIVNFKRRPCDLLYKDPSKATAEQIDFIDKASNWSVLASSPDFNTPEMINFKSSVIVFTNAIFSDENFANRLKSAAQDSDEIVFCVGHPTNWNDFDEALYKLILKSSILGSGKYGGKKSSIIMEAESRAAFLYSKDVEAFGKLPKDSSVLLIDIGSSTIDITAMTAASNNSQYNSGSNYLGARSIDYMIRNWYLKQLKQQSANWDLYQSLVKSNPTIPNALTLACRRAKEEIYSGKSSNRKAVINFGLFPGIRLFETDLDKVIDDTPVANILKETINLSDQECSVMGNKSWKELFRDFLTENKSKMASQKIKAGFIILTGSASKMPFVPQIVLEVFNEVSSDSLKFDMDPSRTISKGLALVGPSNEKSKAFQDDLNRLIDERLEKIVESNIPALGKEMGTVISNIITPKMKKRIQNWKNGQIDTLNNINKIIKDDCSEENLTKLLSNDANYIKTIENWLKNNVGKDIAIELQGLCAKYGVRDISADDLNIMTMPKISIGTIPIDPLSFIDTISVIISLISGVIAAASVGTIMGIIVVVVSIISESLAAALFAALMAMGPAGWTILAAVVGVAVAVLASKGVKAFKNSFQNKVMGWNLPKIARQTLTDSKINTSFSEANLPKQIENAFNDENLKNDIVKKVSANLKGQIEKRAESIKYAIESK